MSRYVFKRRALAMMVCAAFGPQAHWAHAVETGNIHLDAIHASQAYEQGFTGEGVRIGILDSGFDTSHEAFVGKDIVHIFSDSYEELYGDDPKWAEHNHGTHVAGIAAGSEVVDYGVAKDASLLLLSSTLSAEHTISDAVQLYRQAFDAFDDVKIYSNSWGWVRGLWQYHDIPPETDAFESIFTSAVEKDKLLVFAAGNQAGLAPGDPILSQMRDPTKNGHILNVVNIESDHLFEEGQFIHGNVNASVEGSNMGLFAALWTIAAPGTNIVSASAGTADGSITMTGTSMAAPHVSGALALVQQAFPWMSASQLADAVLSTAQKPEVGAYDVIAYNPNAAAPDDTHPNADFKWQYNNGNGGFTVADPTYSIENGCYETNVRHETAAIVFWGAAGSAANNIAKLKESIAERITQKWIEAKLDDMDFELDPESYEKAVYEAARSWKEYFIENCIVVEYGIGAGLLDAGKAVGGIAELNVNRMARWDQSENKWTFELNRTGLSSDRQLAYTLNLAGDGVSRFTNDIVEVGWNPVLHITTEDELKAYNEALESGKTYEGSSNQTYQPENAELPVSLVVSGTLDENGGVVSAGTLVMSGKASYRGSTDVINGATLIVNGSIAGAVNSDASSTIGGSGSVGSLLSKGTLSPGDDSSPGSRLGSLTINGKLELESGSSLVLDVSEHAIDQILVYGSAQTAEAGSAADDATAVVLGDPKETLKITIRTGDYVDHELRIDPTAFFPYLQPGDDLLEQVRNAELTWGGGITFNFAVDEDGFFTLQRIDNGMQKVAQTVSVSGRALDRAWKLDRAIDADGLLGGQAADLVSWIDAASENLMSSTSDEDKAQAASDIASTFAALEPDSHLAFDAAALSRTARLREDSGFSPLADLTASDIEPQAELAVERSELKSGSRHLDSTRTILAVGARRGFGDWALGWRLGAFYDDVEGSGSGKAKAQGIFAAATAVREFGAAWRLFGEAVLGYGTEDRSRSVYGTGQASRFDNTVDMLSFGAGLGIGKKLMCERLPFEFMPFVKASWDAVDREGFKESNAPIAQAYDKELLSVAAFEMGLAFKKKQLPLAADRFYLEGRAVYRNRFHVGGDESYEWAGISDDTHLKFFENRHAFAAQCSLGWHSNSGHDFSLVLDGETGDAETDRWGAALRWSFRF